MKRNKNIGKKTDFKKQKGCCLFCGENRYQLLDVHRITEGANGGRYTHDNSVSCCVRCHRLIHSGDIVIDRYYKSTSGIKLRAIVMGTEMFL